MSAFSVFIAAWLSFSLVSVAAAADKLRVAIVSPSPNLAVPGSRRIPDSSPNMVLTQRWCCSQAAHASSNR
jgi:hypothetical protein